MASRAPKSKAHRVQISLAKTPGPVRQTNYKPMSPEEMRAFVMGIAKEKIEDAKRFDAKEEEAIPVALRKKPDTRVKGKKTAQFSKADLAEFKKMLLAVRKQALESVTAMKATGFNESEDHESDGGDGTNQSLRLQALGHMGTVNSTLHHIDEALARIEDGTYGVCTSCGELIRKPRLMNQPFSTLCMECQVAMEKNKL